MVGFGVRAAAVALALTAACASSAQAADVQIVKEERIKPRVVELTLTTPAFAEPTKVHVNLPVGYDADPARRWPVTYVLAGTMNTYKTFNNFVDGVGLTEKFPGITVSPNGDSGYWSDWYNGGAGGAPMYETYVIDQLIPLIDAHFRTDARRAQRSVMGISMGGYGALMVAARHPDLFGAAAPLSGTVDTNLQPNGAILSLSPTFQGGQPDAIYGPRLEEEVRWRGHNPTDLVENLRPLDLQVRSANGVPNPGLGEDLLSADGVSCLVEAGVYNASQSLRRALEKSRIDFEWADYGAGCHTVANFEREIADTLAGFARFFASPRRDPETFDFSAIEPDVEVFGWRFQADPGRALEFLDVNGAGSRGLKLTGSGTMTVTTPPLFVGLKKVDLRAASDSTVVPSSDGRLRFKVDLGAANTTQQYTAGATNAFTTRKVTFAPHAIAKIASVRVSRRSVKVCATAVGGVVTARIRVPGATSQLVKPGAKSSCATLPWKKRPAKAKARVELRGHDAFGHAITASRTVSVRAAQPAQ